MKTLATFTTTAKYPVAPGYPGRFNNRFCHNNRRYGMPAEERIVLGVSGSATTPVPGVLPED